MDGNITKIRRQLKSIKSTKKLTNAMSLVATAKLQKERGRLLDNNNYAALLEDLLYTALCAKTEGPESNGFLIKSNIDNPLHIVFTSNSGLCGAYNIELLKFVEKNIGKDEPIFAVGSYGIKWLMNNNYMVVKQITDLNDINPLVINRLISNIMTLYVNNEISSIDVFYTDYINTLKQEPKVHKLLPFDFTDKQLVERDILLEPSRDEILNELIPMYISSQIYEKFLESNISENAARRMAMNGADQNAENLIDKLQIKYNQARQASITQEMNEISAGSLK
ncbi:MAG: ATP synthase F1 subunit gamma [Erysipelotrichaceae bacterium]|nr:ATP synthase F1 subunit gamma [Erysipelotrichaceae bacterium]